MNPIRINKSIGLLEISFSSAISDAGVFVMFTIKLLFYELAGQLSVADSRMEPRYCGGGGGAVVVVAGADALPAAWPMTPPTTAAPTATPAASPPSQWLSS
jgi:hypothetical protein